MITLTIIAVTLLFLLGVLIIGLLTGGVAILLTFGDVIVAGFVIYFIIRAIVKSNKKKKEGQ